MDRIPVETEAHQDGFQSENLFERTDNRNAAAGIEGQGSLPESIFNGLCRSPVGRQVGWGNIGFSSVQCLYVYLYTGRCNSLEMSGE